MSLTGHSPQEVDGVPLPMPADLRLCCLKAFGDDKWDLLIPYLESEQISKMK
jgi:hypothetical protein